MKTMENLVEGFKEVEKVYRFCPLIKDTCRLSECAWFLSDRICAISRIAIRLDAFVEGVPIIQLFKEVDTP